MPAFFPFVVVALAACVRTAPLPSPSYWVSSDSSQYSPVARFRVRTDAADREIRVLIDSGTLSIQGEPIPDAPPLMSGLYLTAILAVPDTGSLEVVRPGVGRSGGDRRGWHPIAESDSALGLGQLRYGERAPLPELEFRIRLDASPPPGPLWIVFHISGNTVELAAPLAAGGNARRRDLPGGVQVYACGDHDVRGQLDLERVRALKRAYGIAC